jgi:predicted nucleotidyltransferase
MEKWEKALRKFLRDWENKDYCVGALVTGSYAAGTATKFSDIDVHIILSDKIKWRQRGNVAVDGFLIEYFANPAKRIKEYMEEDYNNNSRTDARMFRIGRIIFDKTGVMKKLMKLSDAYYRKKFQKVDKTWTELQKYSMWDRMDGLRESYDRDAMNFSLMHSDVLIFTLKNYSKYIGAETATISKIDKFFTDKEFRDAYQIEEFPDKQFAKMFVSCLKAGDKKAMMKNIEALYAYVNKKMNNFNIDGWKIRTEL